MEKIPSSDHEERAQETERSKDFLEFLQKSVNAESLNRLSDHPYDPLKGGDQFQKVITEISGKIPKELEIGDINSDSEEGGLHSWNDYSEIDISRENLLDKSPSLFLRSLLINGLDDGSVLLALVQTRHHIMADLQSRSESEIKEAFPDHNGLPSFDPVVALWRKTEAPDRPFDAGRNDYEYDAQNDHTLQGVLAFKDLLRMSKSPWVLEKLNIDLGSMLKSNMRKNFEDVEESRTISEAAHERAGGVRVKTAE